MNEPARILVVDDTPVNVKLLADLAAAKGYRVATASSGTEALASIRESPPDLVLLDVVMPGMSGYEVCRAIRQNPATAILPVVLVTALDPHEERVKGLEAGADDFLTKPIHAQELVARVRSLLRIKQLHDKVGSQAAELAEWNRTLSQRVSEQVEQIGRLARLKRFFSPRLAELIVSGGTDDPLKPHRREVAVVFLDLRGFTAFTEGASAQAVMSVLNEYHAAMGKLIVSHEGTLERFAGDSMMVFFNDPIAVHDPVERAVRMACAMRLAFQEMKQIWLGRGYELDLGIGIAQGEATLGAIGFEGRWDYAAIGSVTNLAARLCSEALGGQILIDGESLRAVADGVEVERLGDRTIKGFPHPIPVCNITGRR
jgi:DNA-binding response OmpR family regulator/GGDEF domain-containing protein